MPLILVALALSLVACSAEAPPPVAASRVMEISGIRPVVNAVALSPDGSLVFVGDMEGELVAREVPSGTERWKARVHPRSAGRGINGVFVSPDGALLATFGYEARTVELRTLGAASPPRCSTSP